MSLTSNPRNRWIGFTLRVIKNKDLGEEDLKNLILEEYTFLKRPVIISGKKIFIGSEKNTLEALKKEFNPKS